MGKDEKKGLEIFDSFGIGNTGININEELPNPELEEEFPTLEEEPNEEQQEETTNESEDSDDEDFNAFEVFAQSLIDKDVFDLERDAEGNLLKEYDSSEEGLQEMISDTLERKYDNYIKDYEESLQNIKIGSELTAKDFLDFVQKGGNPSEFIDLTSTTNYEEVDVEDEDNQRYLVEDKMRLDGSTEEEIEEIIQSYKDSGSLKTHAKIALKQLTKHQKDKEKELIEKQEQAVKAKEKQETEDFKEFSNQVMNSDKLLGINISDKEKKAFLEYLTKPVKKEKNTSYTQYQLENDATKRLEMAYLQFKGGIKSLEKKVESTQNNKLLTALSKPIDKNAGSSNTGISVRTDKKGIPDLKDFLV